MAQPISQSPRRQRRQTIGGRVHAPQKAELAVRDPEAAGIERKDQRHDPGTSGDEEHERVDRRARGIGRFAGTGGAHAVNRCSSTAVPRSLARPEAAESGTIVRLQAAARALLRA